MSNDHHRIRKELVGFLGATDPWRGCYLPFSRYHMGMFQIAVKPRWLESSPSMTRIKMLRENLLHHVTDAVGEELSGYVEEATPPEEESIHWVSQYRESSGSLKAMLEGCEVTLRGARTQARDLMAKVRKIETVSDAHYARIREAVGQVARSLGKATGRRPANLYVVVGVEYVDLTATAETQFAVGVEARVAGAGGGGDATNRTTDNTIAINRIALVSLLKYKVQDWGQERDGIKVQAGNPRASDSAGGTGISGTSQQSESSTTGSLFADAGPQSEYFSAEFQLHSPSEVAGSSLALDDVAGSWTIGEQVPLDDDDDIDSGIFTPQEAFASAETGHEDQLELAIADVEPVASWTIGEQVPLDDDDEIDSGIYTGNEAFASTETDNENQPELASAEESEEPVESWTIGPLDDDDDLGSGFYTPHEAFASAKIEHEDHLELMTADESEKPVTSWTIGEQVPLDDDDVARGIHTPHEAFAFAESMTADASEEPVVDDATSLGILATLLIANAILAVLIFVLGIIAVVLIFVRPTLQTGIERVQTGVEQLQAGFEELLQLSRAFPTLVLLVISSAWILYKTMDSITRQNALRTKDATFDWTSVKSMLPRTRLLMGRNDELRKIREHIEKAGTITSLVGVAGCGKSHLAREAADQWYKDAKQNEHRIVLFAAVANEESYVSYLLKIMKTLGLEPVLQEDGKPAPTAELSRRIRERLAEAPPNVEVLWILDNAPVSADGLDLLHAWLGLVEDRSWSNLRVILTSQSNAYSFQTSLGEIEMVSVDPLPTDVSVALLTKTFPRLLEQEDEKKAATELVVEYLHNLPVAILAVAPLAQKWTFCGYLRRLREKKVTAGVDSVREVLRDALAEARQHPSLARILDVAAFVSPDNIPVSLLGNDEEKVEQLCMLNLLQVVMDEHYSMHGLIQAAAQVDRSPRDAVVAMADAFDSFQDESHDTWPAAVALLPHFEALHRATSVEYVSVEHSTDDLKVLSSLLHNCGIVYAKVLCKLEQSRILFEESLKLKRVVYGATANHASIALTLDKLGNVYQRLGEYDKAKDSYVQALTMYRAVYGVTANHADIASTLSNLGRVYRQLDEYDKAKDYFEQALAMYRAVYGVTSNHADIARTLNNLGSVYQYLGEYEQAKNYHEQALAMYQAVYGAATIHADVARTLNNLGGVYQSLGEYEQAKDYCEQALAMYRAVYGVTSNHPEIARILNNLGFVYDDLGEYQQAKNYLEQALAMKRTVYGATANHTAIAETLNSLGLVYRHLGKYNVAKGLCEQALEMFRAVFGVTANHVLIASTLGNLGGIYNDFGGSENNEKAIEYHKDALAMYRVVYKGNDQHPHIQKTLHSLQALAEKE